MVERDSKGRVLPGQKLALGNKGGGATGRVPVPEWFITGYTEKAFRCLADILDDKTDADIALKQKTALEVINRNCGKVDSKMEVAVGVDAAGGTCLNVTFKTADKKPDDDEV
jgi:hypothetical protein